MSAPELDTPLGQERLAQCVFHLSINGERRSMCEVNALGLREVYYAQLSRRGSGKPDDARLQASPA